MEMTEDEDASIDPTDKQKIIANFWSKTMKKMKSEIDEADVDDFEDP
jgi:G2/mitotic-specific cyclin-B, other